jgi:hypothetical protein
VQSLRGICIIAHDCQRDRTLGGFAFSSSVQEQASFRLLIPIDNDELKWLIRDACDCGDRFGAELPLNAQIRQNLAKNRGRPLIGGKRKAAKRHAHPE